MNPFPDQPNTLRGMMAAAKKAHAFKVETVIMEFTEDITKLMTQQGITRVELARRMEVKPAYITKILRGTSNFTLDSMVKIATALSCDYRCRLQRRMREAPNLELLKTSKPAPSSTRKQRLLVGR